jgi:hypothetical protein
MYENLKGQIIDKTKTEFGDFPPDSNGCKYIEGDLTTGFTVQEIYAPEKWAEIVEKGNAKLRQEALNELTVSTASGKTYRMGFQDRVNITEDISYAKAKNKTSVKVKLSDGSKTTVPISELEEALDLAMQKKEDILFNGLVDINPMQEV